jgi:uncharacterized membrane protein YbhN (UPF0104 family)
LKIAIRILISAGVLAALLLLLPWEELRSAAVRMSAVVWLAIVAAFLAGHRLGVVKWRRMVNIGRARLSPMEGVRCYAAGLFANLCLPSIVGGDVLRAALAGKATGRPEAAVIGGIGDRLCDMVALSLIAGVGAFIARTGLPGWGANVVGVLLIVGVVGAALFTPLVLRRPLMSWPRRLRRSVGRTLVALRRLARAPRTAALVFCLSLVIQTAFVLLNAWIGRTIGIDLPLGVWFFAWPLAKVAGLLPVSLGGLGVRDATLGAILVSFGVPMAEGVVASLIWQSVLIGGGLVAGAVWWLLGRRRTARSLAMDSPPVAAPGRAPQGHA